MKIINEGKATGYIYNLNKKTSKYNLLSTNAKEEEKLLTHSIKELIEKLKVLKSKTNENVKDIIEVYLAFLKDEVVKSEAINRIYEKGESAGASYNNVINKYINKLNGSENDYLKQRVKDFSDIKDKVINQMYNNKEQLHFDKPTILVVDHLTTSQALTLKSEVKAVISRVGGALSHAAIIIKEKNIPYIISNKKFSNDKIVYLDTNKKILKETNKTKLQVINDKNKNMPPEITNLNIKLYLNMSSIEDLNNPQNEYYDGVGLVRSELLWVNNFSYPYVNKQINYYKKILSEFYPKPVSIRLFDIKKDKTLFNIITEQPKEFSLAGDFKEIYKEQLKALILANEPYGNLNIIIPMIRNEKEYKNVKVYLETLKENLKLLREIPNLGIMVETKESLYNIKEYKDVDFVSIGTNDLAKEFFNINREQSFNRNEIIDQVLDEISSTKEFLTENKIPYIFCGDLVSTKYGLTKLLKNGELSFSIAGGFLKEAVKTINNYLKENT